MVENINSESKVQDELSKFNEKNINYLIFRIVEKDFNQMNHLSYIVNNFQTNINNKIQKNQILIITDLIFSFAYM